MEAKSLLHIVQWLLPIWFGGWLLLPVSSRIFPSLADSGLAAGRLLALVIVCLIAFWGASLHLVPLSFSPLLLASLFVLVGAYAGWQYHSKRPVILDFSQHRRALLFSDTIFLLSFLLFLWLRLCQPEIRGQEKPMDSAIIGVLSRSIYLPAENPWFSGTSFTNYYYFGHFMAATLTRTFQTPLPYAYNLAQPLFCAFFISILWSLCASLTSSNRKGLAVTALVGFCGNYEPLRQWYIASQNAAPIWPLNWWSTSRVIPNTINEYPFFTLALGDAHAHFFGLSLFTLFLCTCPVSKSNIPYPNKTLLLQAILASIAIMTNPWDFPILAFIALFPLWLQYNRVGFRKAVCTTLAWLAVVALLALPFLCGFHSPTRGLKWEPHLPDISFLLVWVHFILIAILLAFQHKRYLHTRDVVRQRSIFLIGVAGMATLTFPYLFFIQGHFDGALRYQDTVFKFGLQSWLLIGIALGSLITQNIPQSRWPRLALGCALALVLLPTIFSSAAVLLARSNRIPDQLLSLNGARHLPPEEQLALSWLTTNTAPGDTIIESVGRNTDGTWIGAYSDYARVSSLTGIPTSIGWPQHAIFWGARPADVENRLNEMDAIYLSRPGTVKNSSNRARYIFWGTLEYAIYGPPATTEFAFTNNRAKILTANEHH